MSNALEAAVDAIEEELAALEERAQRHVDYLREKAPSRGVQAPERAWVDKVTAGELRKAGVELPLYIPDSAECTHASVDWSRRPPVLVGTLVWRNSWGDHHASWRPPR